MRAPHVILFDAVGTLFHLPRGVGHHYATVAQRHGISVDANHWQAAFRAAWKAAPSPVETMGPRVDDDRGWWRSLVDDVLGRLEARPANPGELFADLWSEFARPGVWELYPEVKPVLAKVANRFRLGVLSNFDSRLHTILADLAISHFFEHVVVSSEVGAEKPSPRMFADALDRFDALPHEALHVGDEPEADWRGAASAGLRVFELKRPENSLKDLLANV